MARGRNLPQRGKSPQSAETSGGTLADDLEAVLPALSPGLLAPEAVTALRSLGIRLPPATAAGFEANLTERRPDSDLSVRLRPRSHTFRAYVRALRDSWLGGWLARVGEAVDHAALADLEAVWVEWPLLGSRVSAPKAAFASFSGPVPPISVLASLGWMSGEAARALDGRLETLGLRDHLRQIGLAPGSERRWNRLVFDTVVPEQVLDLAAASGWSGDLDRLATVLERLVPVSDVLMLSTATDPGAPLGLESRFKGLQQPGLRGGWDDLLDRLEADGLCRPGIREAMCDWVGYGLARGRGPAHGELEELLGGRAHPAYLRGWSHVKTVISPDRPLIAKGYLGYRREWLSVDPARAPS